MSNFGLGSIKNALSQALEYLPDWKKLNPLDKGKVIDKSFKALLEDLMKQFNMKPGVDYVDNLKDNEPITDFVALSKNADDLIQWRGYSVYRQSVALMKAMSINLLNTLRA